MTSNIYVLSFQENGGHMPPTLYLQADNSTKDNKNAFMMVFLGWLVKNKIFKKVNFILFLAYLSL